jgi:hypothetical protein
MDESGSRDREAPEVPPGLFDNVRVSTDPGALVWVRRTGWPWWPAKVRFVLMFLFFSFF